MLFVSSWHLLLPSLTSSSRVSPTAQGELTACLKHSSFSKWHQNVSYSWYNHNHWHQFCWKVIQAPGRQVGPIMCFLRRWRWAALLIPRPSIPTLSKSINQSIRPISRTWERTTSWSRERQTSQQGKPNPLTHLLTVSMLMRAWCRNAGIKG